MVADWRNPLLWLYSDPVKRPPMRPRLMSAPGSAGCAGAGLPASCAAGSCATDGGEAGAEAVGEVTGDGELPSCEMQNRRGRLRFAPRWLDK